VNYARRQQGLDELSAARIRDFVRRRALERLLQRAFNMTVVPRAVQNAFESRYDEICCDESKVLADVEATLAELQKLGVRDGGLHEQADVRSRRRSCSFSTSHRISATSSAPTSPARARPDAQHVLRTLEVDAVSKPAPVVDRVSSYANPGGMQVKKF